MIELFFLIVNSHFSNAIVGKRSKVILPDRVEASNVFFTCNSKELVCSFVPSIGSEDITYSVTISSYYNGLPNEIIEAVYENGISKVTFDVDKLSEFVEYRVMLSMKYRTDIRNES